MARFFLFWYKTHMYAFVADVHIRPGFVQDEDDFLLWLEAMLSRADAVFILGDLFDYWYTGMERDHQGMMNALSSPKVYLFPGNRDFLLGNHPSARINVFSEEQVQRIYGEDVLICHGHTLTVRDPGFKILHCFGWPVIAFLDRVLPEKVKQAISRFLVRSSAQVRAPSVSIQLDTASRRGVDRVVCGHLHRGIMKDGLIVLPSFLDEGAWLEWDEYGPVFCKGTIST